MLTAFFPGLLLVNEPAASRTEHIRRSPFVHKLVDSGAWNLAFPSYLAWWQSLGSPYSNPYIFDLSSTLVTLLSEAADHNPESALCQMFRHLLLIDAREDVDPRLWSEGFNKVLWLTMIAIGWRLNVVYLEDRLGALQIEAISDPTMRTFLPLTDLRRNVADLRSRINKARLEISHKHEGFLKQAADGLEGVGTVRDVFDAVLAQADHLSETLGKEIQLVIGSVQVRDSDNMKRQADRTLLLTLLAAVYLPLSLVTGIFGMNIKEINGSTFQYWACLAGVGMAFVFTGLLFLSGHFGRKWYRISEDRKAAEFAEGYKLA